MTRLVYLVFFFFLCSLCWSVDSLSSIRASLTLKVSDPDNIADQIDAKNKTLSGYFLRRDNVSLHLKVPRNSVDSLLSFCEEMGYPIDKSYASENHSLELNQSQAKLNAKEKLLQNYLELLKESKLESVLQVERAIVNLRNEIESLKGRMRSLYNKIEFADLSIFFQLHHRPAPNDLVHSPFPWINELNLSDLNQDFQND